MYAYLRVYVYHSLCLTCLLICLPAYLTIYLSISSSIGLSMYLSRSLSLSFYLSVYLSTSLSDLSVCVSACLSYNIHVQGERQMHSLEVDFLACMYLRGLWSSVASSALTTWHLPLRCQLRLMGANPRSKAGLGVQVICLCMYVCKYVCV